jgi:hypothetical protein
LFFFIFVLVTLGECICEDGLIRVSGWVGDLKDLLGALSEFIDLALDSHLFDGVLDFFDINHPLIGEGMEEIECLNGFLPSLLVAEDEVNPFMDVIRHIL